MEKEPKQSWLQKAQNKKPKAKSPFTGGTKTYNMREAFHSWSLIMFVLSFLFFPIAPITLFFCFIFLLMGFATPKDKWYCQESKKSFTV